MSSDYPFDPFVNGIPEPSVPPSAGTMSCVRLPVEYIPYVQGALAYLTKPRVHLRNEGATIGDAIQYGSWFSEFLDMFMQSSECGGGYIVGTYVGQIIPLWRMDIPENCLPMNGGFYEKAEYAELWTHLEWLDNNAYGTLGYHIFDVDSTYFCLPSAARRALLGSGSYRENPKGGTVSEVPLFPGEHGGELRHTLSSAELPAHFIPGFSGAKSTAGIASVAPPDNTAFVHYPVGGAGSPNYGSGTPHNIVQSFLTATMVIVWKVNEPMSHSFRLRQNPTNSYILEQSVDGGAFYEAFDYAKIKAKCPPGGLDGGISDITYITNYYTEVNTTYGGNVTNIYPDAVYGTGDTGDDNLRDSSLCYAIFETMKVLDAAIMLLGETIEDESVGLDDLVNSIIDAGESLLTYGGLVTSAFFLSGGNPYITAVASLVLLPALKPANDNLVSTWTEFLSSEDTVDHEAFFTELTCCIFGSMEGETITHDLLYGAVSICTGLETSDPAYEKIFKSLIIPILADADVFAIFLDRLNTIFTAQKAGVVFDCPCLEKANLNVPGNGVRVETPFNSVPGRTYKVTMSGTYQSGGTTRRDAFFSSSDNWSTHSTCTVSFIRVDDTTVPCPGYEASHVYEFELEGTGNPFEFYLWDTAYGDNSGWLPLHIEYCPSC